MKIKIISIWGSGKQGVVKLKGVKGRLFDTENDLSDFLNFEVKNSNGSIYKLYAHFEFYAEN